MRISTFCLNLETAQSATVVQLVERYMRRKLAFCRTIVRLCNGKKADVIGFEQSKEFWYFFFREMGGAFGSGFLLSKSNDDIILLAMNSSQPA